MSIRECLRSVLRSMDTGMDIDGSHSRFSPFGDLVVAQPFLGC